ncbi:hypothetical protein BKA62DRAFT_794640 [Auriculariales sp. MPI-PUGE-AT-0066]|nr:hypothetical protein BKA62DRAFT_794640 [Auriculariales sp. MPI-PUGE-AT-0066]
MGYWDSPIVQLHWARALLLLDHVAGGIYIWEFITTLRFDLDFVRNRRRLNLGSILYFLCRYSLLLYVALGLCNKSVYWEDPNCAVLAGALNAVGYVTIAFTSGLLCMLMMPDCSVALSAGTSWRTAIVAVFGAGYAIIWVMAGLAIHYSSGDFLPQLLMCYVHEPENHPEIPIYFFVYDLSCLTAVIILLFHSRSRGGGTTGSMQKFLLQQGLLYLAIIAASYGITVVAVLINVSSAMVNLTMLIAAYTAAISATRMQRALVQFVTVGSTTTSALGSGVALTSPHHVAFSGRRDQSVRERTFVVSTVEPDLELSIKQYNVASDI